MSTACTDSSIKRAERFSRADSLNDRTLGSCYGIGSTVLSNRLGVWLESPIGTTSGLEALAYNCYKLGITN